MAVSKTARKGSIPLPPANSMKNMIKKYLNIENFIVIISVILITILAIILSSIDTWLIWISTLLGILSSRFIIEGKWINYIFELLSYVVYIYICLKVLYYGEVILSCFIIVLHLISLLKWITNQDVNKVVKVNKIDKKELLIVIVIFLLIYLACVFLLYAIKSDLPILNAFSSVIYIMGAYFAIRRSSINFICIVLYELTFISLWFILFQKGEYSSFIFLIGAFVELYYNIIGIKKWKNIRREQEGNII